LKLDSPNNSPRLSTLRPKSIFISINNVFILNFDFIKGATTTASKLNDNSWMLKKQSRLRERAATIKSDAPRVEPLMKRVFGMCEQ